MSVAINLGNEYSIIMIDVDNFKNVNDTYGHTTGDQVLQEVTKRCNNALYANSTFGRFGGEEFVILLPHTTLNDAFNIGESLRKGIAETSIKTPHCDLFVTISLGVAALTNKKENLGELLDMADQALYKAKNTGKNKIVRML